MTDIILLLFMANGFICGYVISRFLKEVNADRYVNHIEKAFGLIINVSIVIFSLYVSVCIYRFGEFNLKIMVKNEKEEQRHEKEGVKTEPKNVHNTVGE